MHVGVSLACIINEFFISKMTSTSENTCKTSAGMGIRTHQVVALPYAYFCTRYPQA